MLSNGINKMTNPLMIREAQIRPFEMVFVLSPKLMELVSVIALIVFGCEQVNCLEIPVRHV
jgi:hypothetical protein